MMMKLKDKLPLDHVARQLAADAGQSWNKMADFPGYHRTRWRDEARVQVRKQDPEARIECLPPTWDGREGICFIRKPGQG
jgi:hypothetical protein